MMRIELLDPATPAAVELLRQSDAYMSALYPAESNHLESVSALRAPNVRFFGGYEAQALVACGAIKLLHDDGDYAEIKRVFVIPACRGRGYSSSLMNHLEAEARRLGVSVLRLETGISQPEALALYRRRGYVERAPFGAYRLDPLSLFMEKTLS